MLVWDEAKRKTNLQKHGLDFADAGLVYDNPSKITFESPRKGEARKQDIAMVVVRGRAHSYLYGARTRRTGDFIPGRIKSGERGL
jgi:uncharacterized DUF497 family protein